MTSLASILPWIQIALSIALVACILLQHSGASVGGAFGGSDGSFFYTRRGFERTLFQTTIVLAVLFALSAFLGLVI